MFTEKLLLIEQQNIIAQVEYNNILQEAILSEASVMKDVTNSVKKDTSNGKLSDRIKETLKTFFSKMVVWFQDRMEQLKSFLSNQFAKFESVIANLVRMDHMVSKKSTIHHVKIDDFRYGKITNTTVRLITNALSQIMTNPDSNLDDLGFQTYEVGDKRRSFRVTIDEVFALFKEVRISTAAVKKIQHDAIKMAKDGIKTSRDALNLLKKENGPADKITTNRNLITKYQAKIRSINKATIRVITMYHSVVRAYARAVKPGNIYHSVYL